MKREVRFGNHTIVYELTRKRVRRINARVRKDGTLVVSAPPSVNIEHIDAFLLANANKLLPAIVRAKELLANIPQVINGTAISILGVPHTLVIRRGSCRTVTEAAKDIVITLHMDDTEREAQRILSRHLEAQAKLLLSDLFSQIYFEHFFDLFPKPKLRFRRMRSSWGNCRRERGIITLNVRLLYAPKEVIRYVIMHELVHMLHPDHSARFWGTLSHFLPEYSFLRSQLSRIPIAFDSFL